jgi:ABC-type molybdenum transport system ATPase subunit/photorepair protein PhrA
MPTVDAVVECPIADTFRVRQVAGLFDLPLQSRSTEHFSVELPDQSEDWQIGVIVGPSGSGKSTIARAAYGAALYAGADWSNTAAVVDGFGDRSIKEITATLTAVGFSSPPAWVKPYAVLSNGEKFRCDLARAMLATPGGLVAFDEFTSVVDRTVARIGSAAVAKAIHGARLKKRFVAVSCHYDIVPWLSPDWVLDMATGKLARGRLRRPDIRLDLFRARCESWQIFKRHHYLSQDLHRSAACFAGYVDGSIATFTAVLYFPHATRPGWREHRTVCLPDYQGVGLGAAMSEFVAGMYRSTGQPYYSTTSHPALIRHRCKSPLWRVTRKPIISTRPHHNTLAASGSLGRMTAGFEYVGPIRRDDAVRLGVVPGVPRLG